MNNPSEPGSGHPGDPLDPMTLVNRVADLNVDRYGGFGKTELESIVDQARAIQREHDPVEPDYTEQLPF